MPGSRAAAATASRHHKSVKPQAKRHVPRDRPSADAKPAPVRRRSSSTGTGKSSGSRGRKKTEEPAITEKTLHSASKGDATTWELCSFLVLRGLSSLCFAVPHLFARRLIFNDPFAR